MTSTYQDIGKPEEVDFSKVFLDPNNPRIAPDRGTRYEDPSAIFGDEIQKKLTKHIYDAYHAPELEESIVAQGWKPLDPIIVWEHPAKPGHYIVVEGNTRISVLRHIRDIRLEYERKKLEGFIKKGGRVPTEDIRRQQHLVDRLEEIISDTGKLLVYPVLADTIEDLEKKLPILLGVRHITHARSWSPYATNLYITSLYKRLFRERHGDDEPLRLESDLMVRVGEMVSQKETKTRRNIQAASAFGRFKNNYEDRLPDGEKFTDEDHYFFELILQHKYAQTQFMFDPDRLYLPDESEKALFEWAFSKPRKREDENQNIFYKAENIRLWATMAKYDNEKGTNFASEFDVSAPEMVTKSMHTVEFEYTQHKRRRSPLDTLESLFEALKDLKGETMVRQAEYLEPTLEEIFKLTDHYLRMIKGDRDAA